MSPPQPTEEFSKPVYAFLWETIPLPLGFALYKRKGFITDPAVFETISEHSNSDSKSEIEQPKKQGMFTDEVRYESWLDALREVPRNCEHYGGLQTTGEGKAAKHTTYNRE